MSNQIYFLVCAATVLGLGGAACGKKPDPKPAPVAPAPAEKGAPGATAAEPNKDGDKPTPADAPPAPAPTHQECAQVPAAHQLAFETDVGAPHGPVTLKVLAPKEGEVLPDTKVSITADLQGYKPQKNSDGMGPHVHVILDNEPYRPWYDVAQPFELTDLKPGAHTLRLFPSRPWHESIKDATAFASVNFFVKEQKGEKIDLTKPTLTYSRPKGEYAGSEAYRVMLDYFVTNAEISPTAFKVRYRVDGGTPVVLSKWAPVWIEGMEDGEHTVVLDLLDAQGKEVPGPFNHTERKFKLDRAPKPAAAPAIPNAAPNAPVNTPPANAPAVNTPPPGHAH